MSTGCCTPSACPTWVAQRLWLGTLLVLAGTGVWWCARLLGLSRTGATAAAVLYQLSPYVLLYVPRTSVILLPWAGLGWFLGLTVLAVRRGGWRYPAAAALVVATMAGTNATAAVLVGLGPVLWLVWAIWGSREVSLRRGLAAGGKIALLSLGTCAAWIVAIVVEARYGADVLAYSETLSAVTSTSLASEILRGLGYWLFYGGDVTGPWNSASQPYLTAPLLIGLGLLLALAGVAAAVLVRWANRGFVALLLLVRRRRERWRPPAGEPLALRSAPLRLGPVHDRARPAEQHSSPSAGRARAGAGDRRRHRRTRRATPGDGAARRRRHRRAGAR